MPVPLQRDAQLEAGEVRAQAAVDAAEGMWRRLA
jgi:hypothetical protein